MMGIMGWVVVWLMLVLKTQKPGEWPGFCGWLETAGSVRQIPSKHYVPTEVKIAWTVLLHSFPKLGNTGFHFFGSFLFYRIIDEITAIHRITAATTVKHLSSKDVLEIEIDLPSVPEQTKIAEILSTVDRAIEQTEALIAKQQRLKTGLMQDLLTRGIDEHGNLRSEQTHKFKDSPLGRIPVEWEVTPAKDLCDAVIDCKNRTPPAAKEGHPVIRTPNVRNGEFVLDGLAWTDPHSYEIWVARGKPRAGDVVITREAPFGEACQIPADLPAPCLGQRMMMYQTNPDKLRSDYLVFAIHSEAVQSRLLELAGGSTVSHVRVGDIRSLSIPHPVSVTEQAKIASALSGVTTTLKRLTTNHLKLRSLKTALMQDLLTGRKRVTALLNRKEASA
jgi:type I restriction enzyme S subunit